jgi:hypothetical protein
LRWTRSKPRRRVGVVGWGQVGPGVAQWMGWGGVLDGVWGLLRHGPLRKERLCTRGVCLQVECSATSDSGQGADRYWDTAQDASPRTASRVAGHAVTPTVPELPLTYYVRGSTGRPLPPPNGYGPGTRSHGAGSSLRAAAGVLNRSGCVLAECACRSNAVRPVLQVECSAACLCTRGCVLAQCDISVLAECACRSNAVRPVCVLAAVYSRSVTSVYSRSVLAGRMQCGLSCI